MTMIMVMIVTIDDMMMMQLRYDNDDAICNNDDVIKIC